MRCCAIILVIELRDHCVLIIFSRCSERNEKFDAIVIEQLWFQCYYSLVKFYNYPALIGFLSVGNLPYAMDSVGKCFLCFLLFILKHFYWKLLFKIQLMILAKIILQLV